MGDEGRFQTIVLITVCMIMYQNSTNAFVAPFLFYQNDYQCHPGIANCREYVCKLPEESRSAFVDPKFSSMISRFGDFRCS